MTQHHDDDLRDAFSVLRGAEPPPATYDTIRSAHRVLSARPAVRTRRRRRGGRPLALSLIGITVAGTAAAAITTSGPFDGLSGTATSDAPAARTLGPLLKTLDGLSAQIHAPGHRPPNIPNHAIGSAGAVRGATITRHGVTVDIAITADRICLAAPAGYPGRAAPILPKDSAAPHNQMGCFPIPVPATSLPSLTGHDSSQAWLVAIIPDDVSDVRAVAADGRTSTPAVTHNVAIAMAPDATRITTLAWTNPNGKRIRQDLTTLPPTMNGDGDALLRVDP